MKVLQFDRYGAPDVLRIAERSEPGVGVNDVLVRVHAASVGWGDCKLRSGLLQDSFRIDLPKIPGRYGSGTVVSVGPSVRNTKAGDAVVIAPLHSESGSAAEYVCVSSDRVGASPRNLDHIQTASMIQGAVSAYACLAETARLSAGQKVLIHGGAGSIGSACIELARHLDAVVTATCRDADRDYVHSLGAAGVVAFDREDFTSVVSNQDVVVDLVGGDVHRRSYTALRRGGRLVYLNARPVEVSPPSREVKTLNATVGNNSALLNAVCRLAERGVFGPKIGKVLPLKEGARAHRLQEERAVKRGRIVLRIPE